MSTTETECTGLSHALRNVILMMQLLSKLKKKTLELGIIEKKYCRVFEDNSGALEMTIVHKYHTRTKHLNMKLHHFFSYIRKSSFEKS